MKILENYIAPTEHSQGDVGDIWIDKSTGDVYKCTAVKSVGKDLGYITTYGNVGGMTYTWEKLGGGGMTVFYSNDEDGYLYWDQEYSRKVSRNELEEAFNKGVIYINLLGYAENYVAFVVTFVGEHAEVTFKDVNDEQYSVHTSEWVNNGPPV